LQEINTAVNNMDQGTQQNAAMVEEQTAASHALAREAASLNELLHQFRLSDMPREFKRPAAVTAQSRPAASPARALGRTVAKAFGGKATAAAVAQDEWEEF
jgi:methyl-accepting chemotaxis protein